MTVYLVCLFAAFAVRSTYWHYVQDIPQALMPRVYHSVLSNMLNVISLGLPVLGLALLLPWERWRRLQVNIMAWSIAAAVAHVPWVISIAVMFSDVQLSSIVEANALSESVTKLGTNYGILVLLLSWSVIQLIGILSHERRKRNA